MFCALVLIAAFLSVAAPVQGYCPEYTYSQCPGNQGGSNWSFRYSYCSFDWDCFQWLRDCRIEGYEAWDAPGWLLECERGCRCWFWEDD